MFHFSKRKSEKIVFKSKIRKIKQVTKEKQPSSSEQVTSLVDRTVRAVSCEDASTSTSNVSHSDEELYGITSTSDVSHKDEELSSIGVKKVKINLGTRFSYEVELRRQKAVLVGNRIFSEFIIPGYCEKNKELMVNQMFVIKKHQFYVHELLEVVFTCNCDQSWQDLVSALSENITSIPERRECIHISSSKRIIEEICHDVPEDIFVEINENDVEVNVLECDSSKIAISLGDSLGVVGYSYGKLYCFTCKDVNFYCAHIEFAKKNAEEYPLLRELSCEGDAARTHKLERYSREKIPFHPNEAAVRLLKLKPEDHLKSENGIFILPKKEFCFNCNERLSFHSQQVRKKLVTRDDIFDALVSFTICSCGTTNHYDGGEDLLLNMQGFLLDHRVLRDYMNYFIHANSMTFVHYYTVWQSRMSMFGHDDFASQFSYKKFVEGWYGFLSLLNVNFSNGMVCSICGPEPDTVVCDGTSVGFQKRFLHLSNPHNDDDQVIKRYSYHDDRIAFKDKELRSSLTKLSMKQMSKEELFNFLKKSGKIVGPMIKWIVISYELGIYPVKTVSSGILDFIQCIGSESPVTTYIPASDNIIEMVRSLFDSDVKRDFRKMAFLQLEVPVIYGLVKDVRNEDGLPEAFKAIIFHLIDITGKPFSDSYTNENPPDDSEKPLVWFPNQPEVRRRGVYEQDFVTSKNLKPCKKNYRGHQSLMAGVFTIYCPHGICSGFSCMESAESPNIPFTIFKTRWNKAPKLVIYDNACKLHAYCLNRDPLYFKDTKFLVDRFHWKNHSGCSVGYNIDLYTKYENLNSQVNEQQNSLTRHLARQLSYMNSINFMSHCSFFIWFKNQEKLKKQKK